MLVQTQTFTDARTLTSMNLCTYTLPCPYENLRNTGATYDLKIYEVTTSTLLSMGMSRTTETKKSIYSKIIRSHQESNDLLDDKGG